MKVDPNNSGLKSGLANATSRISSGDDESPTETPSTGDASTGAGASAGAGAGAGLGGMADMFRNYAGGGGGMPDLASLMNNPQVMAMAQQMTANGELQRLMQNPALANMVRTSYEYIICLPVINRSR